MSENSITKFRFHEDELDVVRDGEKVWVALKRACENIGLSFQPQIAKLQGKPWATITFIVTVAEDGKTREQAFLDLDSVAMWLATVEPSRVAEEIRPKLERYQVECARVLRDYFFGKTVEATAIPHALLEEMSYFRFKFKELEATVKGIDKATVSDWAHKIRVRLTPKERRWIGGQMYHKTIRAGMIPGYVVGPDPKYTVRAYPIGVLELHFPALLDAVRAKARGPRQTVLPFEPAGK